MRNSFPDQRRFQGFLGLTLILLISTSCLQKQRNIFRVVSRPGAYILQSPDRNKTVFPDILREYNNFVPGKGSIDLLPQMELRIENAYYQPGSSRQGVEGFLGTEVARYRVLPAGLQSLSVQPMKSRPPQDLPVDQLIPTALTHAKCYRLYYEIVFHRLNNTKGSVLLAAESTGELDRLAAQLDQPEVLCAPNSPHCAAFPEACSVSVEIEIVVNGEGKTVDWGSNLQDIVRKYPRRLKMKRLYAGRLTPVQINNHDPDALKLPLLPADQITFDK